MMQLNYCRECKEVFEVADRLGQSEIVSGMHKENCSAV